MAVIYEKVTLLVANNMGYSITNSGCIDFEEPLEEMGFKLIGEEYEELDGPQIIQKDESA